jgi:hypothetical protein
MKRALLITVAILMVLTTTAKKRTERDIRAIAVQIFAQQKMSHRAASETNMSEGELVVLHKDSHITVIGHESQGFAIVANDDVFQPTVGYSDGVFDLEQNDGLAWFVNAVNLSMQQVLSGNQTNRTPIIPTMAPVEPLLRSTWNQNEPFNNLCPQTTSGKSYPCGCVATAMGQIMNYHKYPEHGIGQKQYSFKPAEGVGELLYANFEETTYDWPNILDNYTSGEYTDEQANAVATLILHCGVAVEMQYTPNGSGAYSSEARNGLIKNFGYHENLGQFFRDYYTQEAWMHMIFDELNCQRPIYYAGADASQGGHAFVIDGYDANGLVHVNWGWGPNGGNGYFDIALLNPSGRSFSNSQNMILGIAMPTASVQYESHIVSDSPFSAQVSLIGGKYYLTGVSVGTTMWNLCGETWEGKIAVVLQNADHTYVLQSRTVSKTANSYNVITNLNSNFTSVMKFPEDLADGEYRLFVGSMDDRDTDWRLVHRQNSQVCNYIVNINQGIPSIQSSIDDNWVTAVQSIVSNNANASVRYFDLQGRETSPATKGLLIRKQGNEVKKVIVR